ncbi:MAG: TIGR04086 family membrane protein [Acidimicrobiales bacterium]
MGKRIVVESGRDRRALVADAGWGRLSVGSLLAGVLVAYGAFAILAGLAGGILQATSAGTDITARWGDLGVAAGLVVAGLLFLSYVFGGYVAGRMARRAGAVHGAGVFVLGVIVVGAVALIVRQAAGTQAIVDRLRDLGLPTTTSEWGHVGTVAGLASLAAMLVGSVLGGVLGERWHARLLARALDPEVGAEADARREAARAAAEASVRRTGSQERVDAASLRQLRDGPDTPEDDVPTTPVAHGTTVTEGPPPASPAVAAHTTDAEAEADAVARRRAELTDRPTR